MDIESSFTTEAIEAAGANLDEEDEGTLRQVIAQIFSTNEISHNAAILNVAMLSFIAGRAYQEDMPNDVPNVELSLPPAAASEFIEFLIAKIQEAQS